VPQRESDLDVCVEVNFFSHCFERSASRNQTKRSKQQKYGIQPKSYPKTKETAQYPRQRRRLLLPTQRQKRAAGFGSHTLWTHTPLAAAVGAKLLNIGSKSEGPPPLLICGRWNLLVGPEI
jgi:hypothetical protein